MISTDYLHQNIDWWHSPIIGSNETYNHEGDLKTQILNTSVTIGLNDYFNINVNQMFGLRTMNFVEPEEGESVHHRDESSDSDFDNAEGGLLGDTKINLKYLITNTGKQAGSRIFIGSGISIPSKNTITSNPYIIDEDEDYLPHRHFALSDGAFKYMFELQWFYKQSVFPVFYGLAFNIEQPLKENKYGYLPPTAYNANFLLYTKKISFLKSPLGFNLNYIKTSKAFWNGNYAKNSDSSIIAPGLSLIFNTKSFTYGLKLSKEFVTSLAFGDNALEQRIDSWTLNLSIRKILDYTIPFLYY